MADLGGGDNARRVRIYLKDGDRIGSSPAHLAVLDLLRREGAAGATVFEGVEGFGTSGRPHGTHLYEVTTRGSVVVEWIDVAERVDRVVRKLQQVVRRGLITVDETRVVLYAPQAVRELPGAVTAADVMSRDPVAVSRELPLGAVVRQMFGRACGMVPVVEDGRPVGLVTSDDLVRRGGLSVRVELLGALETPELHAELDRLDATGRTAGDVMTPDPVTALDSTPLPAVAETMASRHLQRLPVVDGDGHLVGVVSRVDVLRSVTEGFAALDATPGDARLDGDATLGTVMRADVIVVAPDTQLPALLEVVVSAPRHAALVVDAERRVLGIVTDAELIERVTPSLRPGALKALMHRIPLLHGRADAAGAAERHATARTAAELMTAPVATASADTPLREAIATMLRERHRLVAVVDDERRLLGVVDRDDVLRGLVT